MTWEFNLKTKSPYYLLKHFVWLFTSLNKSDFCWGLIIGNPEYLEYNKGKRIYSTFNLSIEYLEHNEKYSFIELIVSPHYFESFGLVDINNTTMSNKTSFPPSVYLQSRDY